MSFEFFCFRKKNVLIFLIFIHLININCDCHELINSIFDGLISFEIIAFQCIQLFFLINELLNFFNFYLLISELIN